MTLIVSRNSNAPEDEISDSRTGSRAPETGLAFTYGVPLCDVDLDLRQAKNPAQTGTSVRYAPNSTLAT